MKKIIFVLILIILVIFTYYLVFSSSTSDINDSYGNVIQNSISEMKFVKIGGVNQFLLIRGHNKNNPILLFLHGGPGSPETGLVRKYLSELEKHFNVVLWEQRGSGKSFSSNIPTTSMTLKQFINDTHEVTHYLKKRFNKNKVYLFGHSWGSYIAVHTAAKFPEDYYSVVTAGLLVNTIQQEDISYNFSLQKALELKNMNAFKKLKEIGPPVKGLYSNGKDGLVEQRKILTELGGSFHSKDFGSNFMISMIFPKEYTLLDSIKYLRGIFYSIDAFMPVYNQVDLFNEVTEIKIPFYVLTGRYDYQTPFMLANKYFEKVKSPKKSWIWFEHSAHMQIYEESDKFIQFMIHTMKNKNES